MRGCRSCNAACCRWGHAIRVGVGEKDGLEEIDSSIEIVEEFPGEWFLQHKNGVCPFLDEDDKCGIYEKRPQVCRDFDCSTLNYSHAFLQDNPHLRIYKHGSNTKRVQEYGSGA